MSDSRRPIDIRFDALHFKKPPVFPRPGYVFAVEVQIFNVGVERAYHVATGLSDPCDHGDWVVRALAELNGVDPPEPTEDVVPLAAEIYVLPSLSSGGGVSTFALGVSRKDGGDPTGANAWDFFKRAWVWTECWDDRGHYYLFFPGGGGPFNDSPWTRPQDMLDAIAGSPSRGTDAPSLGIVKTVRQRDEAENGSDVRDCFIVHASEDKDAVARPLALALSQMGFRVWYDEFSLEIGDSLRRTIRSRHCELKIRNRDFEPGVLPERMAAGRDRRLLPAGESDRGEGDSSCLAQPVRCGRPSGSANARGPARGVH